MPWTHIASATFANGIGSINSTGANFLLAAIRFFGASSGFANNGTAAANVWTLVGRFPGDIEVYYCDNPAYTGPDTGVGGSNTFFCTSIAAFQRPAGTLSVGTTADNVINTTSSLPVGPVTPSANDALIATFLRMSGNVTVNFPSGFLGAGKLDGAGAASNFGGGAAYLNQTTAAAVTPTWTLTGGTSDMVGVTVPFTVAAAGDTTPPTITGPGGSANGPFGISTAENTTAVGTFTADESVTWTKTGTDQALFSLSTTGTTCTVAWASAPNFEGIGTNPKTFTLTATDAANNARNVTINVTVTNVNEAPSFSGTITVPTLTQGTAMTPINLGGFFADPEGLSLSYALVGSWPAGLSIVSGQVQGTPSAPGTFSGLTVTATDGTNSPVSSNAIGFTVNASGGGGDTTAPVITGPGGAVGATSSISVPENTTAVHTFTANESVTWSLNGGADVARFAIGAGGALSFLAAPDFEAPTDADANNTYVVGVRATDAAGNATTQTCTVTVTNVAEATFGFDLHTAAGFRLTSFAGSGVALQSEVGTQVVVVARNTSTGAEVARSGTLTADSNGRLPRWTNAAFTASGQSFDLEFRPQDGRQPYVRRGVTS